MKKRHTEEAVLLSLRKKRDLRVVRGKVIYVKKTARDIGNGTLGKLDYLRKVHKYVIVKVDKF
jgi:hypothetical protein